MVQAVLAYYFVAYCASWHLPEALPPLSPAPQDIMLRVRPLEAADWAEVPLAIQVENPDGAVCSCDLPSSDANCLMQQLICGRPHLSFLGLSVPDRVTSTGHIAAPSRSDLLHGMAPTVLERSLGFATLSPR